MPAATSANAYPDGGVFGPTCSTTRRDHLARVRRSGLPLGILYFFVSPTPRRSSTRRSASRRWSRPWSGSGSTDTAPAHHWWLFAAGLAIWCMGEAYLDCYRWILKTEPPYPGPAGSRILPWLSLPHRRLGHACPRLGPAAARRHPRRSDRRRCLGDSDRALLLGPIFVAESSSTLATLTALGVPVADVLLLAGLTQLVFRGRMPNFALTCISVAIISTLSRLHLQLSRASKAHTASACRSTQGGSSSTQSGNRGTASVDGTNGVSTGEEGGNALARACCRPF